MDELFVIHTPNDYDMFLALHKFSQKSNKPKESGLGIFINIMGIIFFSLLITYIIVAEGFSGISPIWYVLILLFAALVIYIKFFAPKIAAKNSLKTQKDIAGQTVKFIFYDNSMKTVTNMSVTDENIADAEFFWGEDENYFYLTKNKFIYIVLSKSGFEKGSPDEFRRFLEAKPMFSPISKGVKK